MLPISIHTPAKGVTAVLPAIPADADYFNPHSREGSDDRVGCIGCALADFNPHSREGSDLYLQARVSEQVHFNPHSREGSDETQTSTRALPKQISIHTPAKGVTKIVWVAKLRLSISIHTPAKGVT